MNLKEFERQVLAGEITDFDPYFMILINDEDPYIRQAIIEEDLRLGLGRLDNDDDRDVVRRVLERQTNDEIDLDILKAYLDAVKEYQDTNIMFVYPNLKLKYDALTAVPTTIEKTMTPAQLYASDNPLWARDYTAETIRRILTQLRNKPKTEESFNEALEASQVRTVHTDKYGRTYVSTVTN